VGAHDTLTGGLGVAVALVIASLNVYRGIVKRAKK
jgi:hypothetical protein